jgi:hypothetical protein
MPMPAQVFPPAPPPPEAPRAIRALKRIWRLILDVGWPQTIPVVSPVLAAPLYATFDDVEYRVDFDEVELTVEFDNVTLTVDFDE